MLAVPAREGHHLCPHTTAVVTAVLEVGGDVRRLPGVTRIVEQVEQAGQVVNFRDYAAAFDSAVACIYTRRSRLLTDTDSVCSCTVTSLLLLLPSYLTSSSARAWRTCL